MKTIFLKEPTVPPQYNPNPFKELLPSPWVLAFMLIFLGLLFWRLFNYVPEESLDQSSPVQEQTAPSQTESSDKTL